MKVNAICKLVDNVHVVRYRQTYLALTAATFTHEDQKDAYVPLKMYGEKAKYLYYYIPGDEIVVDGFLKKLNNDYELVAEQISSYWLGAELIKNDAEKEQERLDKASQIEANLADLVCLLRPERNPDTQLFSWIEEEQNFDEESVSDKWIILGKRRFTYHDFTDALETLITELLTEKKQLLDLMRAREKAEVSVKEKVAVGAENVNVMEEESELLDDVLSEDYDFMPPYPGWGKGGSTGD
nr:hypothetical protein [Cyanidioschyzonaceae sp. 1]